MGKKDLQAFINAKKLKAEEENQTDWNKEKNVISDYIGALKYRHWASTWKVLETQTG